MEWSDTEGIITFVFEAFDEPWKGSPEPMEPEKHWGLFKVDRSPKLVVQDLGSLSSSTDHDPSQQNTSPSKLPGKW